MYIYIRYMLLSREKIRLEFYDEREFRGHHKRVDDDLWQLMRE